VQFDSSLDRFREIWAWDFEYIAREGERPIPVCMVARELRTGRTIRLWQDELRARPPFQLGSDALFVSFQAAAELSCHLVLGWPRPANLLDFYVEYRWVTNGVFEPGMVKLLNVLGAYGLKAIGEEEKTKFRDLVLRGGPWSDEERQAILDYCETDVQALQDLLPHMTPVIDLPRALWRGRYMFAVTWMEHVGIPFDLQLWTTLQTRWEDIKQGLITEVDRAYRVYENGSFNTRKFIEYLIRNEIPWPCLKSGEPELTDDVFEERAEVYPQLRELRYLREALEQMGKLSFSVGQDGFNRAWIRPFWTVTGRNQPKASKFLFGAASWLRGLAKAPPGYGIAYLDWVQQEFGAAGALSNDQAMLAAYRSGDSYLWFAKETGDVPSDATKETHELVREHFKQCVLGTQYEMQAVSLASRIGQSPGAARRLLRLHRETFAQYWAWLDNAKNFTFINTWQTTVFGWRKRITESSDNPRAAGNFFSQANGAEMMRLAAIFGAEAGILICAPVHDAFLIMAPLDRLAADIARMRHFMEKASEIVLGGFRLRTEVKEFPYPKRYSCKKGEKMWDRVMKLL
jgi:DNA polymerase family A